MYRQHRSAPNKGGGVLLYLKDTLHSEPLPNLSNSGFSDSVWAQIRNSNGGHTFIVGVCYRSTSSTPDNNAKLLELIEEVSQYPHNTNTL